MRGWAIEGEARESEAREDVLVGRRGGSSAREYC